MGYRARLAIQGFAHSRLSCLPYSGAQRLLLRPPPSRPLSHILRPRRRTPAPRLSSSLRLLLRGRAQVGPSPLCPSLLIDSRPEVLPMRALLALFCLVTFTTSASAECAWVLWGETMLKSPNTPLTTEWRNLSAGGGSERDCSASRASWMRQTVSEAGSLL